jgi:hypothetical protein
MIRIREASEPDINYVFNRSQVRDVPNAGRMLGRATAMSVAIYAGMVDETPACLYGLIPPTMLSNRAYLWLLTTESVDQHKFLLVRHSQVVIEKLLEEYDCLVGDTLLADGRAMRWLKWLGAEFEYPVNGVSHFKITRQGYKERRWTR